jgi:hypothetical protein
MWCLPSDYSEWWFSFFFFFFLKISPSYNFRYLRGRGHEFFRYFRRSLKYQQVWLSTLRTYGQHTYTESSSVIIDRLPYFGKLLFFFFFLNFHDLLFWNGYCYHVQFINRGQQIARRIFWHTDFNHLMMYENEPKIWWW